MSRNPGEFNPDLLTNTIPFDRADLKKIQGKKEEEDAPMYDSADLIDDEETTETNVIKLDESDLEEIEDLTAEITDEPARKNRRMTTERGNAAQAKMAVADHVARHQDAYTQMGAAVDIARQKVFQTAEKGNIHDLGDEFQPRTQSNSASENLGSASDASRRHGRSPEVGSKNIPTEITEPGLINQAFTKFNVRLNTDGSPAGLPFGSNRRKFNQLFRDNPEFFALVKKIQTPEEDLRLSNTRDSNRKTGFLKKLAFWAGISAGTAAGASAIKSEAFADLQRGNEAQAALANTVKDTQDTVGQTQDMNDSGVEWVKAQEAIPMFGAQGEKRTIQEQAPESPVPTKQRAERSTEKRQDPSKKEIKIGDTIAFPTTGEKKIIKKTNGGLIESITVPGAGGTKDIFLTLQQPGRPIEFQKVSLDANGDISRILKLDYARKVVGEVYEESGAVKTSGTGEVQDYINVTVNTSEDLSQLNTVTSDDQEQQAVNKK